MSSSSFNFFATSPLTGFNVSVGQGTITAIKESNKVELNATSLDMMRGNVLDSDYRNTFVSPGRIAMGDQGTNKYVMMEPEGMIVERKNGDERDYVQIFSGGICLDSGTGVFDPFEKGTFVSPGLISLGGSENYVEFRPAGITVGKDGDENHKIISWASITAGASGSIGPMGPAGTNGEDGKQGPTGADGTNGTNGEDGPTGPKGFDGTNGTNGKDGPTGPKGFDGTNGTNGTNGADGPTGADGADGPTGADGKDGAEVSTIMIEGTKLATGWVWNGGPLGVQNDLGIPVPHHCFITRVLGISTVIPEGLHLTRLDFNLFSSDIEPTELENESGDIIEFRQAKTLRFVRDKDRMKLKDEVPVMLTGLKDDLLNVITLSPLTAGNVTAGNVTLPDDFCVRVTLEVKRYFSPGFTDDALSGDYTQALNARGYAEDDFQNASRDISLADGIYKDLVGEVTSLMTTFHENVADFSLKSDVSRTRSDALNASNDYYLLSNASYVLAKTSFENASAEYVAAKTSWANASNLFERSELEATNAGLSLDLANDSWGNASTKWDTSVIDAHVAITYYGQAYDSWNNASGEEKTALLHLFNTNTILDASKTAFDTASTAYDTASSTLATATTTKQTTFNTLSDTKITPYALSTQIIKDGTKVALESVDSAPTSSMVTGNDQDYVAANGLTVSAFNELTRLMVTAPIDITVSNASAIAKNAALNASTGVAYVEDRLNDAIAYADKSLRTIEQLFRDGSLTNPEENTAYGAIERHKKICSALKNTYLPEEKRKVQKAYDDANSATTIDDANIAADNAAFIMDQSTDNTPEVDKYTRAIDINNPNIVDLPLSLSKILTQTVYSAEQMKEQMNYLIELEQRIDGSTYYVITLSNIQPGQDEEVGQSKLILPDPVGSVLLPRYPLTMVYFKEDSMDPYNLHKATVEREFKKVYYILKKAMSDRFKAIWEINQAQKVYNDASDAFDLATTDKTSKEEAKADREEELDIATKNLANALANAEVKMREKNLLQVELDKATKEKDDSIRVREEDASDLSLKRAAAAAALLAHIAALEKRGEDAADLLVIGAEAKSALDKSDAKKEEYDLATEEDWTATGELDEASRLKKEADIAFIEAVNRVEDAWNDLKTKMTEANTQARNQNTRKNTVLNTLKRLVKVAAVVAQFTEHEDVELNQAFLELRQEYLDAVKALGDGPEYTEEALANKDAWESLINGLFKSKYEEVYSQLTALTNTIQVNLGEIDVQSVVDRILAYRSIPPELGNSIADAQIANDLDAQRVLVDLIWVQVERKLKDSEKTLIERGVIGQYIMDLFELDPSNVYFNDYSTRIHTASTSELDGINAILKSMVDTRAISRLEDIIELVSPLVTRIVEYKGDAQSKVTTSTAEKTIAINNSDYLNAKVVPSDVSAKKALSKTVFSEASDAWEEITLTGVNGATAFRRLVEQAESQCKLIESQTILDETNAKEQMKRVSDYENQAKEIKRLLTDPHAVALTFNALTQKVDTAAAAVGATTSSVVAVKSAAAAATTSLVKANADFALIKDDYDDAEEHVNNLQERDNKLEEEADMIGRLSPNLRTIGTKLKTKLLSDPLGSTDLSEATESLEDRTILRNLIVGVLRIVYKTHLNVDQIVEAFDELYEISIPLDQLIAYVYANGEIISVDDIQTKLIEAKANYYKTHRP